MQSWLKSGFTTSRGSGVSCSSSCLCDAREIQFHKNTRRNWLWFWNIYVCDSDQLNVILDIFSVFQNCAPLFIHNQFHSSAVLLQTKCEKKKKNYYRNFSCQNGSFVLKEEKKNGKIIWIWGKFLKQQQRKIPFAFRSDKSGECSLRMRKWWKMKRKKKQKKIVKIDVTSRSIVSRLFSLAFLIFFCTRLNKTPTTRKRTKNPSRVHTIFIFHSTGICKNMYIYDSEW